MVCTSTVQVPVQVLWQVVVYWHWVLFILSVLIKRAIGIWRLAVSSSAILICRIDVHLFSHTSEAVMGLIITGNNPPDSYRTVPVLERT